MYVQGEHEKRTARLEKNKNAPQSFILHQKLILSLWKPNTWIFVIHACLKKSEYIYILISVLAAEKGWGDAAQC